MNTTNHDSPMHTECTCGCTRAAHAGPTDACMDCDCQRFYSREQFDIDAGDAR